MESRRAIPSKFTNSVLSMYGKMLRPKIGDALVLLLVLVLAVVAAFWPHDSGKTVFIYCNGEIVYEIDLSNPKNDGKEFVVKGAYTNKLKVENHKVFVVFSDCPDGHCLHSAAVSETGGVICCMPNGMIVRAADEDRLDVIIQ